MQVITKDHSRSLPYVKTLLKELDQVRKILPEDVGKVSQVHFGGGTPNFLPPEELTLIMDRIRENFDLTPGAEIAIEMHPRTSTREFCDNLKTLEFNRISLGIQDFDPKVQKLIHRDQSYEITQDMLGHLRELGFQHFNFDLVYGLPGQNQAGWEDTLKKVLELRPNRLAVYSYAHVPWIRPVQRSFHDSDLPSPEKKLKFFELAYLALTQNGYRPIGMDHFALEEDELCQALKRGGIHRNFMGYSTKANAHQIGFGVSSISYVGQNYFQNKKVLKEYETGIESGDLATFRGFLLSQEDALRRDLITQIMCHERVDIKQFEKKWDILFDQYFKDGLNLLNPLVEDGLVEWNAEELSVRGLGHLFLRNIAMVFDGYLKQIQIESQTPTFSKTV